MRENSRVFHKNKLKESNYFAYVSASAILFARETGGADWAKNSQAGREKTGS